MKETKFRDSDGDLYEWMKTLITIFVIIGIVIGIVAFSMGLKAITDNYEIQAFNRIHETDYTLSEWFWAKGIIKDYHIGTVENRNYDVDLNINSNRMEKEVKGQW